jgi:hypothetical protein
MLARGLFGLVPIATGCVLVSSFDVSDGVKDVDASADSPGDDPNAADTAAPSDAAVETADETNFADGCGCATTTLASNEDVPSSITVDDLEHMVYWTTNRAVRRCGSSGCTTPADVVVQSIPYAASVGVSHIAWLSYDSSVWVLPKAQMDGGASFQAATTVGPAAALSIDDNQPQSLVVFLDPGAGWLVACPAVPKAPSSADCPSQGGAYDLKSPRALVIDSAAYYFIASNGASSDGIFRCVRSGCENVPDALAVTVGSPQRLAQDRDSLYWIEPTGFDGGAVLKTSKLPDSGAPAVVSSGFGMLGAITADDSAIYVTDLSDNSVKRIEPSDGGVSTLAVAQATPFAMALDSTSVYWANQGDGTIRKAAKCARCR